MASNPREFPINVNVPARSAPDEVAQPTWDLVDLDKVFSYPWYWNASLAGVLVWNLLTSTANATRSFGIASSRQPVLRSRLGENLLFPQVSPLQVLSLNFAKLLPYRIIRQVNWSSLYTWRHFLILKALLYPGPERCPLGISPHRGCHQKSGPFDRWQFIMLIIKIVYSNSSPSKKGKGGLLG